MSVCVIFYLLSRCMRPEGPCLCLSNGCELLHHHFLSQADLVGPSRAPLSPYPPMPPNGGEEGSDKGNDQGKNSEKYI